jgi:hypothetical protein
MVRQMGQTLGEAAVDRTGAEDPMRPPELDHEDPSSTRESIPIRLLEDRSTAHGANLW